jgi:hypothetical protein
LQGICACQLRRNCCFMWKQRFSVGSTLSCELLANTPPHPCRRPAGLFCKAMPVLQEATRQE